MSDVLEYAALVAETAKHPGWRIEDGALVKTFNRGDFNGSVAFVNAVANAANALNHHPDIALSWNDVTIRSWSHDVNGITSRDFTLIEALDRL